LFGRLAATLERASDKTPWADLVRSSTTHTNEHVFDIKKGLRRVAYLALPLLSRHVEVGAQRPPHVPGIGTVLNGLDRRTPAEPGQHMIDQQRGAPHRTELRLDQFMELGQPHVPKLPTATAGQNQASADRHTRTGSATVATLSPARRAASR